MGLWHCTLSGGPHRTAECSPPAPPPCPALPAGPTVLRGIDPRLLAALSDNPDLLRALIQRATRLGGGGGARGQEEAGWEATGEGEEDGGESEGSGDEGGRGQQVTCRVA